MLLLRRELLLAEMDWLLLCGKLCKMDKNIIKNISVMFKVYIKTLLVFLFVGISSALFSQNVGMTTTAGSVPSTNAILDLSTGNTTYGLIVPHVTLQSLVNFNPPIAHVNSGADVGMLIYNSNPANEPIGYYYWSGTAWVSVTGAAGGGITPCGAAAANYVPYFTSSSTICNSVIYQASTTTVGVGTINPKNLLDVNGGMALGSYAGTTAAPANGMIISGSVGIDTTAPSTSAILDVNSTTKGLLIPELTTAQIAAMTYPVALGLIVYNTTTSCYEFNTAGTSTGWGNLVCACGTKPATPGPITTVATNVCTTTTNQTFSVPLDQNATYYTWTVPAEVATWTGQGGPTITVDTYTGAGGTGTFSVTATNACGTSAAATISVSVGHGIQTFTYDGTYLGNPFFFSGTTQYFIIPSCAPTLTITAVGGSGGPGKTYSGGGNFTGGDGASLTGTITLSTVGCNTGDTLYIIVAGQATYENTGGLNYSGGGGGATFIWDHTANNTLLVVAGGGGGAGGGGDGGTATSGGNGYPGVTAGGMPAIETATTYTTTGANGTGGGDFSGGSAGTASTVVCGPGCGGAGWGENGGNVLSGIGQSNGGGYYPLTQDVSPWVVAFYSNIGGYGGGGSAGEDGGSGGAGYNGGGGGNSTTDVQGYGGNGGSSYFLGGNITASGSGGTYSSAASATGAGNGKVTITW
jgi:hypothetical protein